MKITESVVWGAVIIVVTLLACATFLIQGGHSSDVRAIAIAFSATVGPLVNLFVYHRIARSTETKIDAVKDKVQNVQETVVEAQKNGG